MPTLTSARSNHRLSQLIARRAVTQAEAARRRGVGAVHGVVAAHQIAQARTSAVAVSEMLAEQGIDAPPRLPLNMLAFTTDLDAFDQMAARLEADWQFKRLVESLVQDAGRAAESVGVTVRRDIYHVRYVNPPCCSRCAVLAGRSYRWSTGFQRHPGCDCTMIPTTVASPLTQRPDELARRGLVTGLSKSDLQALRDGADLGQLVNIRQRSSGLLVAGQTLRRGDRLTPAGVYARAGDDQDLAIELLRDNDYLRGAPGRGRAAGGGNAGRGGRPPAPPTPEPGDEPNPSDRTAFLAYWQARQDALPIDFKGDVLEPHEVRFVERFLGRGETLQWIPRSPVMAPTNDFIWSSSANLVVEVKSTHARYVTIRRAIERSVIKAANQGVIKTNFIVDLGAGDLTDRLRDELAGYNENRVKSRFARLWVMSDDGSNLEEIELRT